MYFIILFCNIKNGCSAEGLNPPYPVIPYWKIECSSPKYINFNIFFGTEYLNWTTFVLSSSYPDTLILGIFIPE